MKLENYPEKVFKKHPELTIRKMTCKDIGQYCLLFQRVFSNPPWYEKWNMEKIDTAIRKLINSRAFIGLTAESGSQIIGFLTGYRLPLIPWFYIDQLFVNTDYHGKGAGKKLLAQITGTTGEAEISGIVLLTKPASMAENFYLGNGFRRFFSSIRLKGKVLLYKKTK